ncbi:competence type IV pilus minor pilin ComGD [Heyndrickxia acidicola]|uniref:Competence type IV pilus minor pilin ComGD n=1 Tax=Heyndrickxia acidicola TaxID=209389 RepID=A0ABU6MKD8_9BACI|nr:competence type IV pilus minor pilin ComGD [Heyndrickxia acidicola]MED1205144.1 competence type IV pilus minor pilin ComGD [Heyndrickxia acidicola]
MTILRSRKGFTLIEMLVVLSVTVILISLGGLSFKPLSFMMDRKMFISQLEADLYYAQSYAINRRIEVYVQFYAEAGRYVATDSNHVRIIDRTFSPSTKILSGTNLTAFSITPDGNISRFGTMYFKAGNEKIKLVVNIGRGRFSVS